MWWLLPVLGAAVAGVVLLKNAVSKVATYTHPPRTLSWETPAAHGFAYESIMLTAEDGKHITAWHIPAAKRTNKSVLVLHGYQDNKGTMLDRAAFLQKHFNLLLIDFRGHGASDESPTTFGFLEQRDVKAALDYLKKKKQRAGIFGISMGAATALLTLPNRNVKAVVADSPYASITCLLEKQYGSDAKGKAIARVIRMIARLRWNIDTHLSAVEHVRNAGTPLLLIHGSRDMKVPASESKMLASAAKHAELWTAEAGHAGMQEKYAKEYEQRVLRFFSSNL